MSPFRYPHKALLAWREHRAAVANRALMAARWSAAQSERDYEASVEDCRAAKGQKRAADAADQSLMCDGEFAAVFGVWGSADGERTARSLVDLSQRETALRLQASQARMSAALARRAYAATAIRNLMVQRDVFKWDRRMQTRYEDREDDAALETWQHHRRTITL